MSRREPRSRPRTASISSSSEVRREDVNVGFSDTLANSSPLGFVGFGDRPLGGFKRHPVQRQRCPQRPHDRGDRNRRRECEINGHSLTGYGRRRGTHGPGRNTGRPAGPPRVTCRSYLSLARISISAACAASSASLTVFSPATASDKYTPTLSRISNHLGSSGACCE